VTSRIHVQLGYNISDLNEVYETDAISRDAIMPFWLSVDTIFYVAGVIKSKTFRRIKFSI